MPDERYNIDICSYCLEYTYIVCQQKFSDGLIKNVCEECYRPSVRKNDSEDNDQDDTSSYFL